MQFDIVVTVGLPLALLLGEEAEASPSIANTLWRF